MMTAMRSGLSLIVVSWMLIGTAVAQEKTGTQKRADALFEEGRKLLNAGNPAGACAKFDEAIKLEPDAPGTMLNLGLCNEQLNKYRTALFWFRKAQARAFETGLPDYEEAAKQHTADLAGKVATIKLEFASPAPEGTRVRIDGQEVSPAEYLSVEVDPGPHTLVAGAPGHKIFSRDFNVEGRGGQTLTIELVEGDNSVVVDPGSGRRKVAVATVVGGGALMGASFALTLIAKSAYGKCAKDGALKENLTSTGCPHTDPAAATDYANDQRWRARYVYTPMFAVGALAVAIGAVLYVSAPEKERVDRTVFSPVVGPGQVGFALSGGF
jgi:hypothetical protein